MSILDIRDLQVSVKLPDGELKPILAGRHADRGGRARRTPSWAPTAPASPRWPTRSPATRSTRSPAARSPSTAHDVLSMTVDERARAGLFLAMQYPVEVPGVSVANFLRTAKTAIDGEAPKLRTWGGELKAAMERLGMDPAFAQRNVNEGFSGGEKKRHEIVQLELLKPKVAILDETDSGLDIDALRVVSEGVNRVRETGETGILLITHYTRILRYVKPDFVHVFVGGRIVEEGGPELAERLEAEGYERYLAGAGRGRRSTLSEQVQRSRAMTAIDVPAGDAAVRATCRGSTWRRSGRTSRSSTARSTGTGWSTSTPPTRRRSRARSRRDAGALRAAQRQRGPLGAHARHRGDRGVRGRAGEGGRVHRRRLGRRGRVHQELHRGDQPGGVRVAQRLARPGRRPAVPARPGRRDRHLRDGAPLEHRAVAAAVRADRRDAALVRHHRRRPAGRVHSGRSDQRAHQARLDRARLQHPRHGQRHRRASATGPARSARCSCWTPRRRCRTCRSTWSTTTPTSSPSPGTRCSARPASACCGAGPSCSPRCRRSSAAAR